MNMDLDTSLKLCKIYLEKEDGCFEFLEPTSIETVTSESGEVEHVVYVKKKEKRNE